MSYADDLFSYVRSHHPRSLRGIEEAREVNPAAWHAMAEQFLGWAARIHGDEGWAPRCVDAFARFSTDVILCQARYEDAGHYQNSSYDECNAAVYSQREVMDDYLWGVFLTNFLWSHHMELSLFFRDRFLARLPSTPEMIEIAPGHGGWGVWALSNRPDARLNGFDISPSSMAIANLVAGAAGVSDRATYTLQDALNLGGMAHGSADAVICSFLIEHLEQPERLVEVIAHLLKPEARAYLTGALTAAQVDHIFEFRRESELVAMCEKYGLRVLETMSVSPRRILPKARFIPRSMGLIVERRDLS
jgi:SAM-dependent methyltransferase